VEVEASGEAEEEVQVQMEKQIEQKEAKVVPIVPDIPAEVETEPAVMMEDLELPFSPHTGFHIVRSGKAKKKHAQPAQVEPMREQVVITEPKSVQSRNCKSEKREEKRDVHQGKKDAAQPKKKDKPSSPTKETAQYEKSTALHRDTAPYEKPNSPTKDAAHHERKYLHVRSKDPVVEASDHVEVRFPIEKGPFDLLSERRNARLLEIERTSRARCALDIAAQAVRLSGSVCAVAAARRAMEDLCAQWIEVADNVWRVLLQSQKSEKGYLCRMQEETGCSILVDPHTPRIRLAGSTKEAEAAQFWLWQLYDKCETSEAPTPAKEKGSDKGRYNAKQDVGSDKDVIAKSRDVGSSRRDNNAGRCRDATILDSIGKGEEAGGMGKSTSGKCVDDSKDHSNIKTKLTDDAQGACYFVPMPMPMPTVPVSVVPLGVAPAGQFPLPLANCPGDIFGAHCPATYSQPARDDGANSLAAHLAEKFPSARIIVGAPDAQDTPCPRETLAPPDSLQSKMNRLQELLQQSRRVRV
jgi:hypothetical protein